MGAIADLSGRSGAGDRVATRQLYDLLWRNGLEIARRQAPGIDHEAVVAEVIAQLWRGGIARLREFTFFRRMVVFRCLDALRHARYAQERDIVLAKPLDWAPFELLESRDLLASILRRLCLSDRLVLGELATGASRNDVARRLGISPDTGSVKTYRALIRARKAWREMA